MGHETSEDLMPEHGRQHVADVELTEAQLRFQTAYEGFEDLGDEALWSSGDGP